MLATLWFLFFSLFLAFAFLGSFALLVLFFALSSTGIVVCFLYSFSLVIVFLFFLFPWFCLRGQTGAKRGSSVVEIIVFPSGSILFNHVGITVFGIFELSHAGGGMPGATN